MKLKMKNTFSWAIIQDQVLFLTVKENEGIIISTKTDPIILLEAKIEGKNISSKKQLIQQLNPSVGECLSD